MSTSRTRSKLRISRQSNAVNNLTEDEYKEFLKNTETYSKVVYSLKEGGERTIG